MTMDYSLSQLEFQAVRKAVGDFEGRRLSSASGVAPRQASYSALFSRLIVRRILADPPAGGRSEP